MRALEKDLAAAERARKEKTMATRYHKVKFFGAHCPLPLPVSFTHAGVKRPSRKTEDYT